MTLEQAQYDIIEEFEPLEDWLYRYQLIIDMGGQLDEMPQKYKTPEYIIEGCQSRVWIKPEIRDDKIFFYGDSDAIIVKGIVNMLFRVLNNRTAEEIVNADLFFIEKIGLNEHLSPTRSNGLTSMLKQMKLYAFGIMQANSNISQK